jgi:hypothetical protein
MARIVPVGVPLSIKPETQQEVRPCGAASVGAVGVTDDMGTVGQKTARSNNVAAVCSEG